MATRDELIQTTGELISDIYSVDEVKLVKTNDFDFLINYLANIKYDTMAYADTLYNENNPGLSEKYSSLFFHANLSNYSINFSIPSIARSIMVIEKETVTDSYKSIFIPRETQLVSVDGIEFSLISDINVSIVDGVISATMIKDENVIPLTTNTIPHPSVVGLDIYVIDLPEVFRQQRITNTIEVIPDYKIGDFYKMTLSTTITIEELVSLDVYKITGIDVIEDDLNQLTKYGLGSNSELIKLATSFDRYSTGSLEDKILVEFSKEIALFPGDGLNGKKLNEGDRLYIRAITTKGSSGNVVSFDGQIKGVRQLTTYPDGGSFTNFIDVSCYFPDGSFGGETLSNVKELREKIVNFIYTNNTPVTRMDFKNFYENVYGNAVIIGAVNASRNKYISVYTPVFDKVGHIYKTNSLNIPIVDLPLGTFLPELDYNYLDNMGTAQVTKCISPVYIDKLEGELFPKLYTISPTKNIPMVFVNVSDIGKDLSKIIINYDYVRSESYVYLDSPTKDSEYLFSCDLFTCLLNPGNAYTYVISELDNCATPFISNPITDIELTDTTTGIGQSTDETFTQLEDLGIMGYVTIDNVDYWSNLPVFDFQDYTNHGIEETISLVNSIKFVLEPENKLIDIEPVSLFANTMEFDNKYRRDVFVVDDNVAPFEPSYTPIIDIVVNGKEFAESALETVEHLRNLITLMVRSNDELRGFELDYNEYNIENLIKEEFSFIKNVRMVFPLKVKTNSYKATESSLVTNSVLDKLSIISYVPPYFSPNTPEYTIRFEG